MTNRLASIPPCLRIQAGNNPLGGRGRVGSRVAFGDDCRSCAILECQSATLDGGEFDDVRWKRWEGASALCSSSAIEATVQIPPPFSASLNHSSSSAPPPQQLFAGGFCPFPDLLTPSAWHHRMAKMECPDHAPFTVQWERDTP